MRIDEITDFVKLKPELDSLIRVTLDRTIRSFKDKQSNKQLEKLRHGDSTETTVNAFAKELTDLFAKELVEEMITIGSKEINHPIKVVWREMGLGEASAHKNVISLSMKYLLMIYKAFKRVLSDHVARSEGDSIYWDCLYLVNDDNFSDTIRSKVEYKFNKLPSIFMHELVHIQQHSRQNFGKEQYRSYLGKKSEFDELSKAEVLSLTNSSRYKKLYLASPQEIDAFAHNIAYEIIDAHLLDFVDASDNTNYLNEITKTVINKVNAKIGKPVTVIERKIWKRYIKKTVILVDRYLDKQRGK